MPGPFAPGTHAYDPNWTGLTWNDQDPASPVSADRLSRVSDQVLGLTSTLTGGSFSVLTVAGTPSDSSWSSTPTDGRLALDTTTGWLHVRSGGDWFATGREEFNVTKFHAKGVAPGSTPTVLEVAQFQACHDAALAAGGTMVIPPRSYKVYGFNWSPWVRIEGLGSDWSTNKGAMLYGETGSPTQAIINLPSAPGNYAGFHMRGVGLLYGKYGIKSSSSTVGISYVFLDHVYMAGQTEACWWTDCYQDTMYVTDSYLSGGNYVIYHVGSQRFDKCSFVRTKFFGGSTTGACVLIDTGIYQTQSLRFQDCIFHGALGHNVRILGAANAVWFDNCNTEQIGQYGKNARTTIASLAAGATSATLVSLTTGGAAHQTALTLNGSVASSGTPSAITLNETTNQVLYQNGTVLVDGGTGSAEAFHFTSRSFDGKTLNISARAVQGTSMAAHSPGATVRLIWSDATHPNGGDTMTLAGAAAVGLSGADLYKVLQTVNALTGVVTWTGATANVAPMTNVPVTNAIYDDITVAGSGITVTNNFLGGEATGGKVRYDLNAAAASRVDIGATNVMGLVYDPGRAVIGMPTVASIRQPPGTATLVTNAHMLATGGPSSETPWSLIGSPAGKPIILALTGANDDPTSPGAFSNVEIRRGDSTRQRFAYFDATNLQLVLAENNAAGKLLIASGSSGGTYFGGVLSGAGDGTFYINNNHASFGDIQFQTRGTTRMTLKGTPSRLDFAEGFNLKLGTVTGTQLGTGTTEKLALWGGTPVVRPSAYTQTYATATKTQSALTGLALTGVASSSTGTALAEPSAAYTQVEMQQNFRRLQDQHNNLVADHANTKQVLNAVIDDLQAINAVG